MINKIKKDKYYSKYYQKSQDISQLEKAGFFDDKIDNLQYNIDFPCTPINKLNLKENEINYVILTTGSYSPVHDGHISILELARNKLTELKYHIAGAYISPSHDSYVSVKNNGKSKKNILERISLINAKINNSDFIMLDPWEGCFTEKAINFTDVLLRLEQYLEYHTKQQIKVLYAYGSDNYEFGLIFDDRPSICIERNQRVIDDPESNILYIKESEFKDLSSSKIRENYLMDDRENNLSLKYLIRDDSSALNFLSLDYSTFKTEFKQKVEESILKNHQVEYIDIPSQLKKMPKSNIKTISLDKYFIGDENVEISRLFEMNDSQFYNKDYIMGDFKIDNTEDYIIVDDDIVTGRTVDYVQRKMSLNIIKKIGLNNLIYNNEEIYDIVDLRDFIFGFPEGGLMVRWGSEMLRVPYIYPFVNLEKRAKIEASKQYQLSLDIINLNIRLYKDSNVILSELDKNFLKFGKMLGFNDNTHIIELLSWLKSKYFI